MADPSNYLIAGNLPFPAGGNPYAGAAQGGTAGIAAQYGQTYNSALQQNIANYQNILQGYQQTMGNQVTAQGAIGKGYNDLYNNVLQGIQDVGASQKQAISDSYAQQQGQASQSLISRGLGNTTVQDSVNRGLSLDKNKADIALSNQMAQLTAGYQSQLGLSGLNYQNQAAMQNTALGANQLGWMNSVTSNYPDAGLYNQLFAAQGQATQADKDRAAMQAAAQQRNVVPGGSFGGAGARSSPNQQVSPFTPGMLNNPVPYALQLANANNSQFAGGESFGGYGFGDQGSVFDPMTNGLGSNYSQLYADSSGQWDIPSYPSSAMQDYGGANDYWFGGGDYAGGDFGGGADFWF